MAGELCERLSQVAVGTQIHVEPTPSASQVVDTHTRRLATAGLILNCNAGTNDDRLSDPDRVQSPDCFRD